MEDENKSKKELINELNQLRKRNAELGDENGQPIALVGISRDITDRKEHEKKLDLQSQVISNAFDAIIVIDKSNKIIYCNKAFEKLFGWNEHELIGQLYFDLVQGFVAEESKGKIPWNLGERYSDYSTINEENLDEIKCYSKYGTEIITDIKGAILRDSKGKFQGVILSIRDISERYKFQTELKKSEERYRYLYNSIDEGFAIIDVIFDKDNKPEDFRFIELNPAYEKQTGIINKQVLGKTAKELKFDFENFWYETYGKVALSRESIRFVNEVRTLNKWLDVYVFKIDLEKGNKVGVLFNDITEEIMYNRKMEELIKMQDELYVTVSHELKTPLNVIFSANQLMDMYFNSNSVEANMHKLIDYNKCIKQNCYRLTKLINNIVDLSKSNSGLLTLDLYNVDIVAVVEGIVQMVAEYLKSKELRIIFYTNVEEKIIACDPYKMERVMLNLISNAIKFSNSNNKIYVNVLCNTETVEITVKDNGVGIEKQNLNNIFNKFYQEDKSLSRNAEGSGIGLSLIKSIVDMHGGRISVESEVKKGSVFKVELPVKTIENQEFREQNYDISNKIETMKIEFSDIYSIN